MRRVRLPSLLGPLALLYLVAEGASAQGQLDVRGLLVALAATLALLVPGIFLRDPSIDGARAVHALGMVCALGLGRYVAPAGLSLVLDVSHALCASAASALVLGIALKDRGLGRKHRYFFPLALGLGACALGLLAVLDSPSVLAEPVIVPAALEHAPGFALTLAALASFAARLMRPRLISSPVELAQDTWVLLGLVPFASVGGLVIAARVTGITLDAAEVALALGVLGLVAGHARALDPEKKLHAARSARALVRAGLTLGLTAALVAFLEPWLAAQPRVALVIASLVIAAITHRALEPGIERWLAPSEGRLLAAIERVHVRLSHASRLEQVAAITLGALRDATADPSARPLLYVATPKLEISLDAAGIARTDARGMPDEIARALEARRGELIVRGPLEAQIVRNPPLRPLVATLSQLDALCVVPLIWEGELEGALLLPRGERTSQLALEEITAIDGLARHVSSLLSLLSAEARAQERAAAAVQEERAAKAELERLSSAHARLRQELSAANALGLSATIEARPIAYDPGTRALLHELEAVAAHDQPWLLSAERGLAIETYARHVHMASSRKTGPFVVVRCASLPRDEVNAAVFGTDQGEHGSPQPGALELSRGGTLLMLDVAALGSDAQRKLALLLGSGVAGAPSTPQARVIASVREPAAHASEAGAGLAPELHARFGGCSRLLPLRERTQDLASLCLLALDRACRVVGGAPLGLAPEAQARLVRSELRDNLLELESVLEHAARACNGSRIELQELERVLGTHRDAPAASTPSKPEPEAEADHSLEGLERRALKGALERCGGNKSEAARLLGLKRTTFLDKLRRHGLDTPKGSTIN